MKNCECIYEGKGKPMNGSHCKIHKNRTFECDYCKDCPDYRPISKPKPPQWPVCICGHITQEHN